MGSSPSAPGSRVRFLTQPRRAGVMGSPDPSPSREQVGERLRPPASGAGVISPRPSSRAGVMGSLPSLWGALRPRLPGPGWMGRLLSSGFLFCQAHLAFLGVASN